MSECPAHTDDHHRYDMKCVCGEKGTVVLSIVADGEVTHIGPRDAHLFTVETLADAIGARGFYDAETDEFIVRMTPDEFAAAIIQAAQEADRE